MIVNGNIDVAGSFTWNSRAVSKLMDDSYLYGLNLIRGFIGGGYIGSSQFTDFIKLGFATDAWTRTGSNLRYASWYGGGASALVNGYVFITGGSGTANDKINFTTDAVSSLADRPSGGGGSMSVMQQGVGFSILQTSNQNGAVSNTLASYGFKAYVVGKNNNNMDILTFSTDTWTLNTNSFTGGAYGVGWFDRYYGWQFASSYGGSNTTTYTMPFSTETIINANTNGSPGGLGMAAGGAEKGVNSKYGKFYLGSSNWSSFVTTVFKYTSAVNTWQVNYGSQTLANNEHAGLMGQHHGYLAGGYNGAQNGHTDRVNYNVDTISIIPDAPRSLSSASPMWSSY